MANQGQPRELTDPAALKALGHPLRQQILRQLRRAGPATSTSLARALGESTGTTSYHLRRLAEHEFVQELPERGNGRERWWQAPEQDIRFGRRSRMSEEARDAFAELGRLEVAADVEAFTRFQQQRDSLGEWGDALLFARGALRLTGEELLRFWNDYMTLYRRYADEAREPAEGARQVLIRFVAFPDVDEEREGPRPGGDDN
ncbi:helix-turn-helix domain-containing protein [Actinoplanes sp. NPDC051633]|uniref:helix-turn-helix domain-containing protein n=1 Tax=Actinoplanes sp. NPDC051633 TaxID=3155670 RepID=UPI0034416D07